MPDKSQKWSGFLGGRLHDANGDRRRLRGGLCASPWAGRGRRAPGSRLRAGGSGGAGRALSGGAVECLGGCGSGWVGRQGQPSDVGSRSSQHQPPMSRRVAQPHRPAASPSRVAQLPAASVLQTRPCWLASPAAPPRRLPVPRQTACLARCGSERRSTLSRLPEPIPSGPASLAFFVRPAPGRASCGFGCRHHPVGPTCCSRTAPLRRPQHRYNAPQSRSPSCAAPAPVQPEPSSTHVVLAVRLTTACPGDRQPASSVTSSSMAVTVTTHVNVLLPCSRRAL